MGRLQDLPAELFEVILNYVPTIDLQQATIALTRALPTRHIAQSHLFHHVNLKHPEQIDLLRRDLRAFPEHAQLIRKFSLNMWTVDPDVALNFVRTLPKLTWLSLCIGPSFVPEHLEEFFATPMHGLDFLALRFRPYVKQASYYQFLKGAYFDSAILSLARWPIYDIPTLSITQDPLDPAIAPPGFAQPLVFHKLDAVHTLLTSAALESLENCRLRIPDRQVGPFVYTSPAALPSVELLDLSTCAVGEKDIYAALQRFRDLRHLIVDRSKLWRGERGAPEWQNLGRTMATAGAVLARQRERDLKRWLQQQLALQPPPEADEEGGEESEQAAQPPLPPPPPNGKGKGKGKGKGRRGLATATISIRDRPSRKDPAPRSSSSAAAPNLQRFHILPLAPSLRTISLSPPMHTPVASHAAIRADFARGWAEGLSTLSATRARLRTSWVKGTRLLRFAMLEDDEFGLSDVGYDGLVDVLGDEDEQFASLVEGRVPVLCLAGSGEREGYDHAHGCGHRRAWNVFEDNL
ncbi:hypothetical protein FA95DRAFT_1552521 [Auriscalpium vulgare]|uniref:Uncharacterized protein n=1 Tax=Auriscalpium vulgare TaxID=40419 RepID=A0ACB8SB80_9AGAM|nr:hypothetical protein FA95DRAFT_1552521 [Auriscalpium vulgare]